MRAETKITLLTPPSAARNCALVAANRSLPEHRQLRGRQRDRSVRRLRPDEPSPLQPLGEQTQPVTVPPQQLDQIAALAAKHEHLTGKRILLQRRLHHPAEPHKSPPHVSHSRHDPNLHPCCRPDHPSKHSITARNDSISMLPLIRTCPLGSSTWIIPNSVRRLDSPAPRSAGLLDRAGSLANASVTRTGSKLTASVFPAPSNPRWYCLRH